MHNFFDVCGSADQSYEMPVFILKVWVPWKFYIQEHRRDIVLFALFFLVSTISFSLGYIIAGQAQHAPIIIQKNSSLW